jgi:hypothetical protein
MGRPFSHKSPAIKTPASVHGHSYNVSTSSHPSSTPLAAPAFGEDALAYNSPAAALIASIGSQGLTPLPSGQDGLGISTKSQALSTKEGSVGGKRNMEEEKFRNLQEVQILLKTRLPGRAICREGVQRIAQHSNLTFAWLDDNNLSIAGNCVDLEIVFDEAQRDLVKDVVLKINTSGVEEHKKDASAVLQRDLNPSDFDPSTTPWKSLEAFSANLDRLAHLDHLSSGLNCFEAVDGLYYSFERIWAEEKKRLRNKYVLSRICEGTLGRPAMHKKRKLGLSLDYWVENRRMRETKGMPRVGDAMDVDLIEMEMEPDEESSVTWLARIGCETGYPPIRVSKNWLADEIFSSNDSESNGDEAQDETRKPIWLDPEPTLVASLNEVDDGDEAVIEQAGAGIASLPKPPNIRFTFDLEPPVLLTNGALSTMFTQGLTINVDISKASTYHQALHDLESQRTSRQSQNGIQNQPENVNRPGKRWKRDFTVYDRDGQAKQARHSYALRSAPPVGVYPMQSFSFAHPRQLAEVIPILRQYALLWSIMSKLVPLSDTLAVQERAPKKELEGGQRPKKSRAPQKKSNTSVQHARLGALFSGAGLAGGETGLTSSSGPESEARALIDVSLNLTLTHPQNLKLDLLFPLPASNDSKASGQAIEQPHFGAVAIEIEANGRIVVASAGGLPWTDSETLRKMASVLIDSEDLGVLAQWIIGRLPAG